VKLSEVKVLPDGKVWLTKTYYLVPAPGSKPGVEAYHLFEILDDTELGEATYVTSKFRVSDMDRIFNFNGYAGKFHNYVTSKVYRVLSEKMGREEFFKWVAEYVERISSLSEGKDLGGGRTHITGLYYMMPTAVMGNWRIFHTMEDDALYWLQLRTDGHGAGYLELTSPNGGRIKIGRFKVSKDFNPAVLSKYQIEGVAKWLKELDSAAK